MLNERDLRIIRHVEAFGFITISQASKMFFDNRAYSYDLARRRLAKLEKQGHINGNIDYLEKNPEKIYYIDDNYSSPSKHTILVMNGLAEIIRLGADVFYFNREQEWLGGNRRSDGYVLFKIRNYFYQVFIEVEGGDTKKKLSRDEIVDNFNRKYTDILDSGEPMQLFFDLLKIKPTNDVCVTTRILVVDGVVHKDPWYVENEIVVQVGYGFEKISQILI